jgi:hypothetical protein
MSKNNGGPAFPKQPHRLTNGMLEGNNEGMTLRDYFAAKAMQGALTGCATRGEAVSYREVAELSYSLADAMLAEREKDNG